MTVGIGRQWRGVICRGGIGMLLVFALAGCGSTTTTSTHEGTVKSANTPLPTATQRATATAATGAPCGGSLWGISLNGIGVSIPLPPQTVGGISETYPSDGAWVGHITRLCTRGNPDSVEAWEETHMSAAGWSYGQQPSNCVSCAGMVWSHANNSHLVQFEQHPTVVNNAVQWSVTVFSRG
jgi:hypothetical protein